jgi:hypothetical protein
MTVGEANAQDTSEHIGPLLNMAFATLLGYAEASKSQGQGGVIPRSFGVP